MKSKTLNCTDEQLSSLSGLLFSPICLHCNLAIKEEAILSLSSHKHTATRQLDYHWSPVFVSNYVINTRDRQKYKEKRWRAPENRCYKTDSFLSPLCCWCAATEVLPVFLLNISQTIHREASCLSIASHLWQKYQLFYAREHFYSVPLACGLILRGCLGDIRAPRESSSLFISVTRL